MKEPAGLTCDQLRKAIQLFPHVFTFQSQPSS
jgi:hypothetical protein